jgi:hypothetical protein
MPPHLVARGESHRSEVGLLAGCGGRWRHHAALHTHGHWRHGRWCDSWRASDCRLCRLPSVRRAAAAFSCRRAIRTSCVCGIGTSSLQDGLELSCGLLGGAVDARAEEVGAEVRNHGHGQHAQHTRILHVELARQLLQRDRHRIGNQCPGRQPAAQRTEAIGKWMRGPQPPDRIASKKKTQSILHAMLVQIWQPAFCLGHSPYFTRRARGSG